MVSDELDDGRSMRERRRGTRSGLYEREERVGGYSRQVRGEQRWRDRHRLWLALSECCGVAQESTADAIACEEWNRPTSSRMGSEVGRGDKKHELVLQLREDMRISLSPCQCMRSASPAPDLPVAAHAPIHPCLLPPHSPSQPRPGPLGIAQAARRTMKAIRGKSQPSFLSGTLTASHRSRRASHLVSPAPSCIHCS